MQVSGFSHRAKRLLQAPAHVDIAFGWLSGPSDLPDQRLPAGGSLEVESIQDSLFAPAGLRCLGGAAEDDEQHDASADLCRAEARG